MKLFGPNCFEGHFYINNNDYATEINKHLEEIFSLYTLYGNEDYIGEKVAQLKHVSIGKFHYTMAAKDNSFSFDFWGTYQSIEAETFIEIILGDGRKMNVSFEETADGTLLTEQFEPENQNPIEMQQAGWQMILDNFKKYVEEKN